MNPFEPPKPKLSASIMGSPCNRRMRYARNKNNLSSDTEEAWADALDREEEEDSVYRQLRREATGEEDPAAAADWGRVNKRPNVSSARTFFYHLFKCLFSPALVI